MASSSNWLYYQQLHNLNYPKEGHASIFWKKNENNTKRNKMYKIKKIKTFIINLMFKLKIYHVITRIFDITGFGDNYFIILKKTKNI